jgi:hypothetical protein
MRTPRFSAGASLYKSSRHYYMAAANTAFSNQLMPQQQCPPAGLCANASRCCRTGNEGRCCDILDRCLDCMEICRPYCDPPRQISARGPCLWQRCVDRDCNVSVRRASGCTECVPPGVQECWDASGNCVTQTCSCVVCGNQCCPSGTVCIGGVCCPSSQVCGNQCCGAGGACCPDGTCCGAGTVCCPPGEGCCWSDFPVCCPDGTGCCPAGTRCVTVFGQTLCIPTL